MLDTQERIIRANRAAQSLFGGGLIGRDFVAVVRHPDLVGAVKAVSGGEGGRTVEFVLRSAVERVFEARVSAFVDFDEAEGAPMKLEEEDNRALFAGRPIILSLYDITTIRRAEQLRSDFVANASHELRTPLTSLIGCIETLRGTARGDTEAHERFLQIMDDQARRMARLVQDLMSLSRIELVEHSPPTEPVDLAPVCERVLVASEQRARAVSVSLSLAKEGTVAPWVSGDADQLTQVVQNLVDNAIEYTRPQTAVRLELDHLPPGPGAAAYEQAGTVVLRVIDNGAGIPRDHVPRLTERFYRVDPARSRQLGGTGLGLAIVKHIVNRHRGQLVITSEQGVGSTFAVRLPALITGAPKTEPAVDASQEDPAQS
jgi:two-component system phosphate regulon sensor histidine kinase PhoR